MRSWLLLSTAIHNMSVNVHRKASCSYHNHLRRLISMFVDMNVFAVWEDYSSYPKLASTWLRLSLVLGQYTDNEGRIGCMRAANLSWWKSSETLKPLVDQWGACCLISSFDLLVNNAMRKLQSHQKFPRTPLKDCNFYSFSESLFCLC